MKHEDPSFTLAEAESKIDLLKAEVKAIFDAPPPKAKEPEKKEEEKPKDGAEGTAPDAEMKEDQEVKQEETLPELEKVDETAPVEE